MITKTSKWAVLLGGLSLTLSSVALAQDSGARLDALVRKGILNDQEAEENRADLTRDSHAAVIGSVSGGKSTNSLAFSGRLQVQYADLGSDANVADTKRVFPRRLYFGAVAKVGADWTATFTYDFANAFFDKAVLEWDGMFADQDVTVGFGLRKVNFGYEETTSSGSLKSIERSGVTRYFVEDNMGRRLGAGSYREGVFVDFNKNAHKGKTSGLFYGAAITKPERVAGTGTGTGSATNNTLAYWADLGYTGIRSAETSYKFGAAFGFLPDQGATLGAAKNDITEYSLYGDMTFGRFNLAGEYLSAEVEGATDRTVSGYWIQPSYQINEKVELVARYSFVDSDGRGLKVSDGVRSAPGSLTGNELKEYYAGLNYYFVGNDVKFQIGYVGGETENAAGTTEAVSGLRSQIQVNF